MSVHSGCVLSTNQTYSLCVVYLATRRTHSSSSFGEQNPCGWLTSSSLFLDSKCHSPLPLTTTTALCTLLNQNPSFNTLFRTQCLSHSLLSLSPFLCRPIPSRTTVLCLINLKLLFFSCTVGHIVFRSLLFSFPFSIFFCPEYQSSQASC